ncbi:MAG: RibD family protein [Methylobacteriaceae bacterium]|nr:RibD family protein [Methylobacteriaceae bacterium]MBV9704498.1 RibD family protein [Methylobacteriaceae bacterium]
MAGDDAIVKSIFAPFLAAAPSRPFVVAQLGQSLDGRIATAGGAAQTVNGPAGLDHLHRLRAHVDAVVVGVGTIIADDPQLTVRRVAGPNPARVVIDASGRLPPQARCLDPASGGCFVICTERTRVPAAASAIEIKAVDGTIPPRAIIDTLFASGFRRLLVEGGARTISRFIDARCIDRLHVTVAPLIIGSGQPGLELRPIADLAQALRPAARVVILDDGNVLFDCDLRSPVRAFEE